MVGNGNGWSRKTVCDEHYIKTTIALANKVFFSPQRHYFTLFLMLHGTNAFNLIAIRSRWDVKNTSAKARSRTTDCCAKKLGNYVDLPFAFHLVLNVAARIRGCRYFSPHRVRSTARELHSWMMRGHHLQCPNNPEHDRGNCYISGLAGAVNYFTKRPSYKQRDPIFSKE